jgi:hypothetical protein
MPIPLIIAAAAAGWAVSKSFQEMNKRKGRDWDPQGMPDPPTPPVPFPFPEPKKDKI